MGFLDNSTVTVDAILTKRGREILSRGGNFNITKFALSDEEIDYTLYDVTHPSGTDSYGAVIENMSLLEATPNRTTFRSFLVQNSLAGVKVLVGQKQYTPTDPDTPITITPSTKGGPEENYIFTIGNLGVVRFRGSTEATLTGKSATLLVQSISQEATTTVTVQGENSGVVETITIKAPTDSTSSVTAATLKQQAKNLPSGE